MTEFNKRRVTKIEKAAEKSSIYGWRLWQRYVGPWATREALAEESGHNADLEDRQLSDKAIKERYGKVHVDGDSAYSGSGM